MHSFFVNPATPPKNCRECGFFRDCGGLDGDDAGKGCFERCESRCRKKSCDCVCPCAPVGFDLAWEEVGGICIPPKSYRSPSTENIPPSYVPQIHHDGGRKKRLPEEWVSIPLAAITKKDKGKLDIRFGSRKEMCEKLQLCEDSRISLSCVSPDPLIESFWRFHRKRDLLKKIADLRFSFATVPNYSFMLDTPHLNSLFNLSRIFRMTERMSEAGIPTVPHINARTKADWKKWEDVLRTHSGIRYVAMEFQTGLRNQERSANFLRRFEQMQIGLERDIHPIVIGGTGRSRDVAKLCPSFTLVDSTPFFKTVKRQVLVLRANKRRPNWETLRSDGGECLGDWLSRTIRLHKRMIYARLGLSESGSRIQELLPPAA